MEEAGGEPWTVMPLEGLWWAEDIAGFSMDHREDWLWTTMDRPAARRDRRPVGRRRHGRHAQGQGAVSGRLRPEVFDEGDSAQVKHHDVYLSNPRRTAPEKLRTILRQPIATG